MQENVNDLIHRLALEELERVRNLPPPPPKPPRRTSVHYTELTEDHSNDPAAPGWNVYVREVGRLIAEGNEGKWVVIAEGRLIGVYETKQEATGVTAGRKFAWPCTLKQVREHEPLVSPPLRFNRCRN